MATLILNRDWKDLLQFVTAAEKAYPQKNINTVIQRCKDSRSQDPFAIKTRIYLRNFYNTADETLLHAEVAKVIEREIQTDLH